MQAARHIDAITVLSELQQDAPMPFRQHSCPDVLQRDIGQIQQPDERGDGAAVTVDATRHTAPTIARILDNPASLDARHRSLTGDQFKPRRVSAPTVL